MRNCTYNFADGSIASLPTFHKLTSCSLSALEYVDPKIAAKTLGTLIQRPSYQTWDNTLNNICLQARSAMNIRKQTKALAVIGVRIRQMLKPDDCGCFESNLERIENSRLCLEVRDRGG
jgi:hypothetical protein